MTRFKRKFIAALIVLAIALPVSPVILVAAAYLMAWFGTH